MTVPLRRTRWRTHRYYATCVIFYRKEDARPFWLAYECLYPRQQEPRTSVMPLRAVSEGGEPLDLVQPAPRQSWIYLPYCICLVSRLPYFGVMKVRNVPNIFTAVSGCQTRKLTKFVGNPLCFFRTS